MKKIIYKLSIFLFLNTLSYAESKIDPESRLKIDKGLETVVDNCTMCHNTKLMLIRGGDKTYWKGIVTLMVDEYGMMEIDEESTNSIVNYLAKNYPADTNKKEEF